ncbi:MAG: enoyl-CoA hydratase-related protein [Wenzhouxiangellaceae bacterium]
MNEQSLVRQQRHGAVVTLTLNRPELHNAFDDRLVSELHQRLDAIAEDRGLRVVVLTGAGASFSAGADLNWMRRMAAASEAENEADALALALLLRRLDTLPQATIAHIRGAALGGGMGLVCCCDIAIADESAVFGLTEVHLGLIPAVISPYVVARIGAGQARALAVSGRRIKASEALRIGLIHHCVDSDQLDEQVARHSGLIVKAAPVAVSEAKRLIQQVSAFDGSDPQNEDRLTAAWIARLRVSPEGQEGLRAFLDKSTPNWRRDHDSRQ